MAEKKEVNYEFIKKIGRIFNARQSRAITLTGNIFDLFFSGKENNYVPIISFLLSEWGTPEINKAYIKVVYELNGPVKFVDENDLKAVKEAWMKIHAKFDIDPRIEKLIRPWSAEREEKKVESEFEDTLRKTAENSILALEFLRQLCLTSRFKIEGKRILNKDLIILIEGADMLTPKGETSRLSEADRKRIAICRDWFCEPEFMNGNDSVIFITESRSKLNEEVSHLPQLLEVEIDSPNEEQRKDFINWFVKKQPENKKPEFWSTAKELASYTAGLSIQALMQLLKASVYTRVRIEPKDVVGKIEEFLKSQLGDDVIEFKKPRHTLADVVGNKKQKKFILEWLIPRIKEGVIVGITVGGAIGVGKTYLFEAVAAILGIPVLVLKNLRSMWFGETDVILERLRRILRSFYQAMLFIDEADTQFGGVGKDVHETERRLTGKLQAMMTDEEFKGKIIWLLITARIYLLSKDLLRKGRAGDAIFALTDPEGEDRIDFIKWMLQPVAEKPNELVDAVDKLTKGYSPSDFGNLRDDLKVESKLLKQKFKEEDIIRVVKGRIPADISAFRRAQALCALLKCSHTDLLPDSCLEDIEKQKEKWQAELTPLIRAGVLD